MIERLYTPAFFAALLRQRWKLLLLSVLLLASAAFIGQRVRADFSVEQFFPLWDPARQTYQRYKQIFPNEDTRIALFWQEKQPLTRHALQRMQQAAVLFEQQGLQQVLWLGNAQQIRLLTKIPWPIPVTAPLLPQPPPSDTVLQDILTQWRDSPLYQGVLWNKNQTVFIISGTIKAEDNQDNGRKRIEGHLTRAVERWQSAERKLVLSGLPIFRSRFLKLMSADQALFMGGGILLTFVLLLLFFRSLAQAVMSLAAVLPAWILMLMLMVLWDKPLTALTITMPLILLVIGLSDTTHILFHYRQRLSQLEDPQQAIVHAFSEIGASCFYTALMTAASFLSLIGTGIAVVVDFAILTAIGMMVAHGCAMIFYPILLSLHPSHQFNSRGLQAGWLQQLNQWVQRRAGLRPWPTTLGFSAVVVVATLAASQLQVNAFLAGGLKASHPLMQDSRWLEAQGFGMFQINVLLEAQAVEAFAQPQTYQWIKALEHYLNTEPLVLQTDSLVKRLQTVQQVLEPEKTTKWPATAPEIDSLLQQTNQWQPAYLTEVFKPQQRASQVTLTIRDQGSLVTEPFLARLNAWLIAHPLAGVKVTPTGTVQLAQTTFSQILSGFGLSLLLDILFLGILIALMFRSWRYGLIALIPNLFPLFVLLGILAICGYAIDTATVLIFSIAFGIAVDATIHLLGLYRWHRQQHPAWPMQQHLQATLDHGAPAIVITTVVIGGGFSALMLSHFEAIYLMGMLIAVGLFAALVADLFWLPALLRLWESKH